MGEIDVESTIDPTLGVGERGAFGELFTSRAHVVGSLEEGGGRFEAHARHTVEVGDPVGLGEHLAGRAATAVAMSEWQQRPVRPALVSESPLRPIKIRSGQIRRIGIGRREMGEDPRPVNALPEEGIVGEAIDLVPGGPL